MRLDHKTPSLSALQKMLLLRRVPVFTQLDDDDLQLIAENVDTKLLTKGDVLYRRGERVSNAYHIVDGQVRIENAGGQFEFVDSNMVGVGSMTMFAQTSAEVTAIAEQDTFALVLKASDIFELFEKRSTILCFVIEHISLQINQVRSASGYHNDLPEIAQPPLPDLGDQLDLIHRTQLLREMLSLSTFRVSITFEMAKHTQPVTLLGGSQLWNAGEEADHFYFIIDGLIECQVSEESEPFVLGARDAIALVDILARTPYSYQARALDKVRALRVPAASFWRVISDNHEFGISVLSLVAGMALDVIRKSKFLTTATAPVGSDVSEWMANLPASVTRRTLAKHQKSAVEGGSK